MPWVMDSQLRFKRLFTASFVFISFVLRNYFDLVIDPISFWIIYADQQQLNFILAIHVVKVFRELSDHVEVLALYFCN